MRDILIRVQDKLRLRKRSGLNCRLCLESSDIVVVKQSAKPHRVHVLHTGEMLPVADTCVAAIAGTLCVARLATAARRHRHSTHAAPYPVRTLLPTCLNIYVFGPLFSVSFLRFSVYFRFFGVFNVFLVISTLFFVNCEIFCKYICHVGIVNCEVNR
jgi:hypothetical protein